MVLAGEAERADEVTSGVIVAGLDRAAPQQGALGPVERAFAGDEFLRGAGQVGDDGPELGIDFPLLALNAEPEREAGMVWVPTGKTIGDLW
ncbi:MAG: hypothetical protein ACRDK7_03245, partial [Solirubrobacteraceae bacterium]